jgi:hypothetical protein
VDDHQFGCGARYVPAAAGATATVVPLLGSGFNGGTISFSTDGTRGHVSVNGGGLSVLRFASTLLNRRVELFPRGEGLEKPPTITFATATPNAISC